VVTGAAKGIGRAIAARLAADGWSVVGVARDASGLAQALGSIGGVAVPGDVRQPEVIAKARQTAEQLGELRAWVNNAAVVHLAPLHLMEPAVIDEVLDINLRAVVMGTREALGSFLAHSVAGSVVNISSIHGRAGFPGYGAYDTAKGGIEALTRYVCVEYGHLGIRCNAVAPGPVRTNIVPPLAPGAPRPASFAAEASDLTPMRRVSEPEEIASVVSFLAGDQSLSVNGHVLAVDLGMSAWSFAFPPDSAVVFG
jgi:NAD(P)-dependent dehydrogenase (short-subunit alcohol dehydrogenase family)